MKMKQKAISVVTLLLTTALLTACSSKENKQTEDTAINSTMKFSDTVYNFDTDWQYYYRCDISPLPITCSEKGYYIQSGGRGRVDFIDRSSLMYAPLCGKANCDHKNPDICDAWKVEFSDVARGGLTFTQGIQFYNGKLYYLKYETDNMSMSRRYVLSCCDENGTNDRQLFELDGDDWLIHRGYVYCFTDGDIHRVSLDSPENKETVVQFEN